MALTKVSGSIIKNNVSLSGNVSIGGTLTYEDVTNVDAVGVVTARTGIKVLAGGANVVGVVTATDFKKADGCLVLQLHLLRLDHLLMWSIGLVVMSLLIFNKYREV